MKSNRKHPAHGTILFQDRPTIIFLTVCTKHRQRWLASETVHSQLRDVWVNATAWLVGRYVIMPDHLHLFAALNEGFQPYVDLDGWVKYWKSQFSKLHADKCHRWQTDHWDTRLRRGESYDEKWEYVRHNPTRQRLVDDVDEWPFQGAVFELRWE